MSIARSQRRPRAVHGAAREAILGALAGGPMTRAELERRCPEVRPESMRYNLARSARLKLILTSDGDGDGETTCFQLAPTPGPEV